MSKPIPLEYVQFNMDADVRLPCTDGPSRTCNALREASLPGHVISYDPDTRVIRIQASDAMRQRTGITAVSRNYVIVVPVEACSWWREMSETTRKAIAAFEAKTNVSAA